MRKIGLAVVLSLAMMLSVVGMAAAITNGVPDGTNHPYVGLAVFDDANGPAWRCSASLLTPTIVLTAGHCTDGAVAARVWFDSVVQGNPEYPFSGPSSYDGTPYTFSDFCIGCGNGLPGFAAGDAGIIVLSEPVPTSVVSTYAALPEAGVVDTLANKTGIDFVGYGVQAEHRGGGQPFWTGQKVRMFAPSELVSGEFVHSAEFLRLALNPGGGSGGTCFGDSGGPDLLAGTNVVLGVNSYVTNSNCTGVGYSFRVDQPAVLSWINSFLQ
ncbi:MAG TPA: trypsin-like serine protease [Anaerolineales bacterium]